MSRLNKFTRKSHESFLDFESLENGSKMIYFCLDFLSQKVTRVEVSNDWFDWSRANKKINDKNDKWQMYKQNMFYLLWYSQN